VLGAARALLPQLQNAPTSLPRVGEFAIRLDQVARWAPPVETPEQNSRRRFHHTCRRVAQHIGKPHVGGVFAQTDGVGEVGIGMILDDEMRRPAHAAQARVDAMKNPFAAGNRAPPALQFFQEGFLRTGPGVASFSASSISESASLVPSMASSSVSR